ncbi:MAG TPA: D-alanyl-D-alanine carboxypeptidase family protein [Gemmatimonadales bacterium]|nr:D-alanyl-D-alanine carboxypeptidase family protein [Gemmatimonadales bacterium]
MASLRTLDARARPIAQAFVRALQRYGVNVTVTSARRDLEKQRRLYADYLAGRSKYPAAPPGKSTHGAGIAFDLHLDPPIYELAGRAWEAAGFTWGGRFNDEIHFDLRRR